MDGSYDVWLGQDVVGRVLISRQGLFCRFLCKCQMMGGMFQLMADHTQLGLLVPEGSQLVLRTSVPLSRFPEGIRQFSVRPRHQPMPGSFVPLSPQEPFGYLRRMEKSSLALRRKG